MKADARNTTRPNKDAQFSLTERLVHKVGRLPRQMKIELPLLALRIQDASNGLPEPAKTAARTPQHATMAKKSELPSAPPGLALAMGLAACDRKTI